MDYTLKEAADELNLTKNTVKGRLSKLPPESSYMAEDGRIRLTESGFQKLKETIKEPIKEQQQEPIQSQSDAKEETALQLVIELLQEQLEVKDRQIESLTAALAAAQALHAGELQRQRISDGKEKHTSFWRRMFSKDKL